MGSSNASKIIYNSKVEMLREKTFLNENEKPETKDLRDEASGKHQRGGETST